MPGGRKGRVKGVRYTKLKQPKEFRPPKGQGPDAEAHFKTWSFTFAGYFEDQTPGGEACLNWAAKQTEEIDDESVREWGEEKGYDGNEVSRLLYRELRSLTVEGDAFLVVKNCWEGNRGGEVWRKRNKFYVTKGSMVAQDIIEHIMGGELAQRLRRGIHDV